MAQFLANVLQNVVGKTKHHVRSSFDFASEITNVRVPEGCIIYSLDVVSLYTNVPVQNVYDIIEQKWREISDYTPIPWTEFKRALHTILGASFFQYNGKIFEQTFGTPMGSPLSPVVASLLMEQLEETAIQCLRDKGINLVMYKRYVDDCLIVGYENDIDCVLAEFNGQCPSIKFTLEKETENSLRFLDLKLSRCQGKIEKNCSIIKKLRETPQFATKTTDSKTTSPNTTTTNNITTTPGMIDASC
ncbi:uncharacterized protein LOC129742556 [Uranotaenia lowii]|nr:uncharacterized protein LOC129742556 [Uranotaenia lowii]